MIAKNGVKTIDAGLIIAKITDGNQEVADYFQSWDEDEDGLDLEEWTALLTDVFSATPPSAVTAVFSMIVSFCNP